MAGAVVKPRLQNAARVAACALLAASCVLAACSCSSDGQTVQGGESSDQTSGPQFVRGVVEASEFDPEESIKLGGAQIDVSHIAQGYVGASGQSDSRLKFEVSKDGSTMYYDLPSDGTPIIAPLSMGDGEYTFSVWENTTGQKYAKLSSTVQDVRMDDEMQPFLHPNVFADFDSGSEAAKLANSLSQGAQNEGDVLRSVYNWVVDNISYDTDKAARLSGKSGYIPNPDETIESGKGVCFDYASLVAAMLRSQGIPCKIVTGNVAPDDIYHAWNMVYIDGVWRNAYINVPEKTWTLVDTTFASSGNTSTVGDGTGYSERYTY